MLDDEGRDDERDAATQLEALYTEMALHSVESLWRMDHKGSDVRPHLWRWETMRRLVTEAGKLVEIERPGERRAVALVNPGIPGALGSTHNVLRHPAGEAWRGRAGAPRHAQRAAFHDRG